MKPSIFFILKLAYYFFIFRLTRSVNNHVCDKNPTELLNYWEVVYQNKMRNMLKNKHTKMFGE